MLRIFLLWICCPLSFLFAQDIIYIQNGSFEGEPTMGVIDFRTDDRTDPLEHWTDCAQYYFPWNTPFDLHASDSHFWDSSRDAVHGNTYVGFVVREDESYESIGQKLHMPLRPGKEYKFSICLSIGENYMSHTRDSGTKKINFSEPCIFRISGARSPCVAMEVLAESPPVDHYDWKEYKFSLTPNDTFDHIILDAYFTSPELSAYYGNLMLDRASNIIEIPEGMHSDTMAMRMNDYSFKVVEKNQSPSEDSLLMDYYENGRKNGLYRYVCNKDKQELDDLLLLLDKNNLDYNLLLDVISLKAKVAEEGMSHKFSSKINRFNRQTKWQRQIKKFLIKYDLRDK